VILSSSNSQYLYNIQLPKHFLHSIIVEIHSLPLGLITGLQNQTLKISWEVLIVIVHNSTWLDPLWDLTKNSWLLTWQWHLESYKCSDFVMGELVLTWSDDEKLKGLTQLVRLNIENEWRPLEAHWNYCHFIWLISDSGFQWWSLETMTHVEYYNFSNLGMYSPWSYENHIECLQSRTHTVEFPDIPNITLEVILGVILDQRA
jgi:hypothetical protein